MAFEIDLVCFSPNSHYVESLKRCSTFNRNEETISIVGHSHKLCIELTNSKLEEGVYFEKSHSLLPDKQELQKCTCVSSAETS